MKKLLALMTIGLFLVVFARMSCSQNTPPATPTLTGPTAGIPGTGLSYTATATDPEGDDVAYLFSWGDGGSESWTGYSGSGEPLIRFHTFVDSGTYVVKVRARDESEAESDWSDSLVVSVGYLPPDAPAAPTGPQACTARVRYTWTVSTTHPTGDSVAFQFDWGDTLGEWSELVAVESSYSETRSYEAGGNYTIKARARDADGRTSDWSPGLTITVEESSGGPPLDLTVAAATDSTVRLSWSPPAEGTPSGYKVYFKPVNGSGFQMVESVPGSNSSAIIDPDGETGLYTSSAIYSGGDEKFCADTVTTIPVHTSSLTVYELNATGNGGYGWDPATGAAALYSMSEQASAAHVDFYITEFTEEYGNTPYSVASPDEAVNDPGNTGFVPNGNWKSNRFGYPVSNENSPLPSYSAELYFNFSDILTTPLLMPVYIQDNHYALAKFTNVNPASGQVEVESWYQPVQGLRLIKH